MGSFLVRRFAQGILTVVLASVLVFLVMRLIPGDPALLLVGTDASPADVEAVRERLGLNEPLIEQYVDWLIGALQADFGPSISKGHRGRQPDEGRRPAKRGARGGRIPVCARLWHPTRNRRRP